MMLALNNSSSSSNNGTDHRRNSAGCWGNTAVADEEAIDKYAGKVLENASPPDLDVDADYLGPYITGVLRAEVGGGGGAVEDLPDYDNLLELLQEHCSMQRQDAKFTLQKIAQAVTTGMIPIIHEATFSSAVSSPTLGPFSSPPTSGGLSALKLLESFTVEEAVPPPSAGPPLKVDTATAADGNTNNNKGPSDSTANSTNPTNLISPVQANNLIPFDLLGAIDAEEENHNNNNGGAGTAKGGGGPPPGMTPAVQKSKHNANTTSTANTTLSSSGGSSHSTLQVPVAAASNASNNNNSSVINSTNSSHSINSNNNTALEEEYPSLADAAKVTKKSSRSSLTRSRQGSIDESSSMLSDHSSNANSLGYNHNNSNCTPVLQPTPPGMMMMEQQQQQQYQQQQQQYQQQQQQQSSYYYPNDGTNMMMMMDGGAGEYDPATMLTMACDMLAQMNYDMGQDAIFHACTMANGNVAVAQYLMDCAMTAPPVCRHLLHSGCYRSDCQFSHDLEGHTCVFWLRGHCNKGSKCPFLHGYNERWLLQLEEQQQAQMEQQQAEQAEYYAQNNYPHPGQEGVGVLSSSWEQQQAPTTQSTTNTQPLATSTNSFANIASKGYNDRTCFQQQQNQPSSGFFVEETKSANNPTQAPPAPTVRIPQDVWNPHERRDASAFHIPDPMERYREVSRHGGSSRGDVIDLHFQSTKTFGRVLQKVLPEKLQTISATTNPSGAAAGVWIVTGTGHHVGSKTHQKGGGVLEVAVQNWLAAEGYEFWKGKDRNGHGGAVFVKKPISDNSIHQQ